ncbi:helix-turn-helix domain-containing protein [Halosimplex halobium]|uniref:helix-turn-helix domain-containing protein n=1 Tax=Halosimplex halobium TaxID=3396618 RepID=UPI003F552E9D
MGESFIAEVVVDHADLPLTPTVRTVSDATVRVESQPFSAFEHPVFFYAVSETDFASFEAALDADPTVAEWRATVTFSDQRVYQVVPGPDAKFTTPKIASLGVQVLSLESADRGWRFRLLAPERDRLGEYWEYCREEGVQFDLRKLYRSGPQAVESGRRGVRSRLTERQLEVARTAARMGYYDTDGASAQAVADELGISRSTLSTHLRRIVGKLFDSLFAPA